MVLSDKLPWTSYVISFAKNAETVE